MATARFPTVPPQAGHYESFYLKAADPAQRCGLWLRYTVHKRPGAEPTGSLWFTLFGAQRNGGPRAVKQTFDEVSAPSPTWISVGGGTLGAGSAIGSAAGQGRSAWWEIDFRSSEPPLRHLPRDWMYNAPLPRTKLESPCPDARFSGSARIDEIEVQLDGWRGMVGHNWGAQHAERWIWLHGADFVERDDAWLDVALGRIKVGPLTTPWVANGTLSIGGERLRLGGIERVRRTDVEESPTAAHFALPGSDLTLQGSVQAHADAFVGWVYADPDGSEHHALNCSSANMELSLSRPGRDPVTLTLHGGATYELGLRERGHGIPIQPFPDG
jgi:hypothetical protein